MTTRILLPTAAALLAAATAAPAAAQQAFALRFDSTKVAVTRDVQYATADTVALRMDVVRPADAGSRPLPTLVFLNRAFGSQQRGWNFYQNWAKAAAARGLTAIVPDIRGGSEVADARRLVAHLAAHGAEIGVDTAAIAVYAASSNAGYGFPFVEDPATTGVKAAVIYYGGSDIQQFRLDLPVLYVRAGLDRPDLNRFMVTLASRAVSQNAPLTFLNHPTGYHGFETLNDDDATREVMERTIAFVKHATSPGAQRALRAGLREATAAAHVSTGKFAEAAAVYRELVAERPEAHTLRLAYGEALIGAQQYALACDELEKLRGKGLGPRDLGLPAARACAGKGDAERAVGWLMTIPARFLPASAAEDPAFASIKDREEFKAVFRRTP